MPPLLVTSDPPFSNLTRQMNKMVEQLHKGYYNFMPSETWTPNVNLYESEQSYLVCVDLAGVDKDKIDLTVADGRLKVRGARHVPVKPDGDESGAGNDPNQRVRVHLLEIDHGAFCREVELPNNVHHEKITASYRNGLLWVEIPKK
jgi:HSP20 family protein